MNKTLPCYIVSDLLPLYQEDILSEETKKDISKVQIEGFSKLNLLELTRKHVYSK